MNRVNGEFISMELEGGQPKVILSFGRDPFVVLLDA